MTEDPKPSFSILDRINNNLGKIVTVAVTIAALGVAMTQAKDAWTSLFGPKSKVETVIEPTTDLKNCLEAKLSHPDVVPLSQWDSMEMRLTGQNDCKAKLAVYLEFKGSRILLEPPFGEPEDRREDRWEDGKLGIGAVDWQVSPPHLVRLRDSLGDRVRVNLNWIVVEADTKRKIDADTVRFWLEDDQPVAASVASTAPL
ncbi:MAG: hypothetical protein QOH06_6270 [Acidobacteriota bacterium]|jgi:hypothetical protein|nr:hypothetical protein [Acidobacteriota bacterium]